MSTHWINGRRVSDAEWFAELDAIAKDDAIDDEPRVRSYVSRDWSSGSCDGPVDVRSPVVAR